MGQYCIVALLFLFLFFLWVFRTDRVLGGSGYRACENAKGKDCVRQSCWAIMTMTGRKRLAVRLSDKVWLSAPKLPGNERT